MLALYDAQQKRQRTVSEHLRQLHATLDKILLTATQLEQLGESRPDATTSARKLQNEIVPLERLSDDLVASCQRLESIALSTQRVMQVKQLYRELSELQSDLTSTRSPSLSEPEISDLERQITREIETFLQLEREADERLRDL